MAGQMGANVVVNDLGGTLTGDDAGDAGPAEAVAAEIRAAGGAAISNSDSVTDYEAVQDMIETAKKEFGGLDSVINPAGILRDKMFHKMSEDDWDAVIAVHLRGSFNVARASVEYFRDKEAGNYVFFTSTTGLIGNIGQANYAAAKLGIVGLSRIMAMEGARKNIRSNVIAPFAWTRMIASIPVTDEASRIRVERMKNAMRPEQVSNLSLALCADSCDTSGQIFSVRGNEIILFSQPRPVKTMANLTGWTPESILDTCLPAMSSDMEDLGPTTSVFPYDPV